MDMVQENLMLNQICNFDMPEILDKTRFWMVRTKKGYFFDEYLNQGYVGLGWNIIDLKTKIKSLKKEQVKDLKNIISERYGDKRPGQAISKCQKFMYDIQIGDIIMIPGMHNNQVAFAVAGEYYEDTNFTIDQEIETISKIDIDNTPIYSVECPYRKRRKVQIIKVIRYGELHIKLSKVLASYQGICSLDEYAKYILDSMYPIYFWREACSFQMKINTSKPIDLAAITEVMSSVNWYMKKVVKEENLSVMLNLNSKGLISFTAGKRKLVSEQYNSDEAKQKYSSKGQGKKAITALVALYVVIFGGEVGNIKIGNPVEWYKSFKTAEIDIQKDKTELEKMELENLQFKIQIYQSFKESGMSDEEIENCLSNLESYGKILQMGNDESNEEFEQDQEDE